MTQAEIIAPHMAIREDLARFAAGETMLEAVDKVAEEHEKNLRVTLLLLAGCRALDARPADPAAVAESFMLKLLSLSGFHPSLTACAVCGERRSPAVGRRAWAGAVCAELCRVAARARVRERPSSTCPRWRSPTSPRSATRRTRSAACAKESRALLYGFAEYHLERRMKSVPMLVRTAP